jgi:hypothetical protein
MHTIEKELNEVTRICVPWQCTAIAVQQYTEQYTFFSVCAHFHSGYVPIQD